MKKLFLFLIILCVITSCGTYMPIGNVTTFNNDGTISNEYKDVLVKNDSKFFNPSTCKYIFISSAVPYIIEYEYKLMEDTIVTKTNIKTNEKEELIKEFKQLKVELEDIRIKLESLNKNDVDYIVLTKRKRTIIRRIGEIDDILTDTYCISIAKY